MSTITVPSTPSATEAREFGKQIQDEKFNELKERIFDIIDDQIVIMIDQGLTEGQIDIRYDKGPSWNCKCVGAKPAMYLMVYIPGDATLLERMAAKIDEHYTSRGYEVSDAEWSFSFGTSGSQYYENSIHW